MNDQGTPHASVGVILADECAVLRIGLRQLLEPQAGFAVLGEASDGDAALGLCLSHSPNLFIFDVDLPAANLPEILRQLINKKPTCRLIAFTRRSDYLQVMRMLKAGVHGYLLKSAAIPEVLAAIAAVNAGETFLSPAVASLIYKLVSVPNWERDRQKLDTPLTEREREVLEQIVQGKTSKQIAGDLYVTVRTVESHRALLMKKLDLHSVAELTKYAIREGITSLDP